MYGGGVELQKTEPLGIGGSHCGKALGEGRADPITQLPAHEAAVTGNLSEAGEGDRSGICRGVTGTHQAVAGGAGVWGEGLPVAIGLPVVAAAWGGDRLSLRPSRPSPGAQVVLAGR